MTVGTCSSCIHAHLHEQLGATALYCHGAPPSVVILPSATGLTVTGLWPPMQALDSCGQFEAQPKTLVTSLLQQ